MCEYCNMIIYIKTQKIIKDLLVPLTREEQLRQEVEDKTGEMYLEFPHKYCPMCGEKLKGE